MTTNVWSEIVIIVVPDLFRKTMKRCDFILKLRVTKLVFKKNGK